MSDIYVETDPVVLQYLEQEKAMTEPKPKTVVAEPTQHPVEAQPQEVPQATRTEQKANVSDDVTPIEKSMGLRKREPVEEKKEFDVEKSDEFQKLQQRYDSLQGKYNAEIENRKNHFDEDKQRLSDQNKILVDKLRETEAKLADVQDKLDYAEIYGQEFVDDMGDELIGGVDNIVSAREKALMQKMQDKFDSQAEQIAKLTEMLTQTTQKTEEMNANNTWASFDREMKKTHSNYDKLVKDGIVVDHNFQAFLNSYADTITEQGLDEMFNEAIQKTASVKVADNIITKYNEYLEANKSTFNKDDHVAPPTADLGTNTDPNAGKYMSKSEVKIAFNKMANNEITYAEYQKIEDEFYRKRKEGLTY